MIDHRWSIIDDHWSIVKLFKLELSWAILDSDQAWNNCSFEISAEADRKHQIHSDKSEIARAEAAAIRDSHEVEGISKLICRVPPYEVAADEGKNSEVDANQRVRMFRASHPEGVSVIHIAEVKDKNNRVSRSLPKLVFCLPRGQQHHARSHVLINATHDKLHEFQN